MSFTLPLNFVVKFLLGYCCTTAGSNLCLWWLFQAYETACIVGPPVQTINGVFWFLQAYDVWLLVGHRVLPDWIGDDDPSKVDDIHDFGDNGIPKGLKAYYREYPLTSCKLFLLSSPFPSTVARSVHILIILFSIANLKLVVRVKTRCLLWFLRVELCGFFLLYCGRILSVLLWGFYINGSLVPWNFDFWMWKKILVPPSTGPPGKCSILYVNFNGLFGNIRNLAGPSSNSDIVCFGRNYVKLTNTCYGVTASWFP